MILILKVGHAKKNPLKTTNQTQSNKISLGTSLAKLMQFCL